YTKWHHNMTIELLSQPGYERSVEQVLKLARPDMYASGNAVIATPTILKELSVFPQPLQKPHPQLWMPLTSERSIRWASARGMNGGFKLLGEHALLDLVQHPTLVARRACPPGCQKVRR